MLHDVRACSCSSGSNGRDGEPFCRLLKISERELDGRKERKRARKLDGRVSTEFAREKGFDSRTLPCLYTLVVSKGQIDGGNVVMEIVGGRAYQPRQALSEGTLRHAALKSIFGISSA